MSFWFHQTRPNSMQKEGMPVLHSFLATNSMHTFGSGFVPIFPQSSEIICLGNGMAIMKSQELLNKNLSTFAKTSPASSTIIQSICSKGLITTESSFRHHSLTHALLKPSGEAEEESNRDYQRHWRILRRSIAVLLAKVSTIMTNSDAGFCFLGQNLLQLTNNSDWHYFQLN